MPAHEGRTLQRCRNVSRAIIAILRLRNHHQENLFSQSRPDLAPGSRDIKQLTCASMPAHEGPTCPMRGEHVHGDLNLVGNNNTLALSPNQAPASVDGTTTTYY
jgi:hypothetical protein